MSKRTSWGLALFAAMNVGFAGVAPAHAADPLGDVASVVNSVVGPRACSLTATSPSVSTGTVRASASVTCNRTMDEIDVKVCIQVRQAVVSESVTWQNHGACGANAKQRASSVSAAASGPCLPGTWSYRTVASGGGYVGGETPWTGIFVSNPVTLTCAIA